MKLRNTKLVWLLIIIGIGAFLRFYKLSEIPSGVYVDEAAIGYNAYSILETGRDEFGFSFPVFLRSFGAFSSPLYVYLSIPLIKLFGLSEFSIRFLSALSGTLTIPIIYLILQRFLKKRSEQSVLLGTLVFAISPWHIFFSRGAFEANLGLLILSLAILAFLSTRRNKKYYLIGVFLLAISTYAYHSLRLVPAVFLPVYSLFLVKNKYISIKDVAVAVGIFVIVLMPQIAIMTTPAFSSRASGLLYLDIVSSQSGKLGLLPEVVAFPLAFAREFFAQFISYVNPKNIFFLGDSDLQRSIPTMGLYYSWLLPFWFFGLRKNFLLVLMLVSFIVPAALARDPFSSLRALSLIIPFSIMIAFGFEYFISKVGHKIVTGGVILFSLASMLFLWRAYFVLFAHERAAIWNYGYSELAEEIKSRDEHFVIDTSRIKPPHILLAFYLRNPPKDYQEFAKTKIKAGYYEDLDFDTYYKLRNFETRLINWEEDVYREQILVGDSLSISSEQAAEHFLDKVFEIKGPLNEIIFVGFKTNPEEKCKSVKFLNKNCK